MNSKEKNTLSNDKVQKNILKGNITSKDIEKQKYYQEKSK